MGNRTVRGRVRMSFRVAVGAPAVSIYIRLRVKLAGNDVPGKAT